MGDLKGRVKDLADAAAGPTLDIVASTMIDGVAGTVIPGVGNMILSYKQNRMERRVGETLQKLVERQDELNQAIENLSIDMEEKIKGVYFEMLMDYSINEPQDGKIDYLVNGYINIAKSQNPQEDVVRSYYDTLSQMNMLDLRVFRLYTFSNEDSGDDAYQIMADYQIEDSHYRMVQEKLGRLGLVNSKNEEQRDKNIDAIVEYLEDASKGKKARLKTRKVSRISSFTLSRYGYQFVKFIESQFKEELDDVID